MQLGKFDDDCTRHGKVGLLLVLLHLWGVRKDAYETDTLCGIPLFHDFLSQTNHEVTITAMVTFRKSNVPLQMGPRQKGGVPVLMLQGST